MRERRGALVTLVALVTPRSHEVYPISRIPTAHPASPAELTDLADEAAISEGSVHKRPKKLATLLVELSRFGKPVQIARDVANQ